MIKATVVLAVAWMIIPRLRARSAAERHLVWTSALGIAALLPWLGEVVPAWRPHWAQNFSAVLPGAIENRRHDIECHEQGKADHHQVCRRRLEPKPGAQQGEGDGETGEARHHDKQSRRDGQDRQHGEHLNDLATGRPAALRDEPVEREALSLRRAG